LHVRWLIVFGFGLVHGFGFSFILADRMQFAGAHLISALLAFNVGVEFGQLFVLIVATPVLWFAFKLFARAANGEKIGAILLSAFAAHSAWHWLTERGEKLLQYSWQRPDFDAAFFAATLRWAMLLMTCVGIIWLLRELIAWWNRRNQVPLASDRIHVE
ncbi:MAG TPA: HupE/UreJ family protein, partial [Steroidobacteraceae bacterium]|nr:HupE/UreJ family protein [Steroidobacteraceae bacterium]